MATSEEYAAWIVANKDKQGTPEFQTVAKAYQASRAQPQAAEPASTPAPQERSKLQSLGEGVLRGAAGIGNTLLSTPKNAAKFVGADSVVEYLDRIPEAMKWLDQENASNPISYGAGKLGAEVAMTAPVGGVIGRGIASLAPMAGRAAPIVNKLAQATTSGGMSLGGPAATTALGRAGDMGLRMAGGAINGGATAGLVDPESAGTGAMIGAAIPGGVALAGAAGRGIRNSLAVSPEVAKLAERANALGIEVPADRIANSKPLNALAASLEYVPFSGRAATSERMGKQLNTALSRTFGQESDNVTMALRNAADDLGGKFDDVLKSNTIKVNDGFLGKLADVEKSANAELVGDAQSTINKQISNIMEKAASGEIDGQAAYNIKRTLDRLGKGSGPDAFHARELRDVLMDGLNESLGPDAAKAFAKTRQQYGNMRSLEKLAQNGAEGEISAARLGNMKNIRNKDLQELADISAQFLKTRESPHGALQRLVIGGTAGSIGGASAGLASLPYLGGAALVGRGANSALNSNALRNALINGSKSSANLPAQDVSALAQLLARSAPVALTPSGRQ